LISQNCISYQHNQYILFWNWWKVHFVFFLQSDNFLKIKAITFIINADTILKNYLKYLIKFSNPSSSLSNFVISKTTSESNGLFFNRFSFKFKNEPNSKSSKFVSLILWDDLFCLLGFSPHFYKKKLKTPYYKIIW